MAPDDWLFSIADLPQRVLLRPAPALAQPVLVPEEWYFGRLPPFPDAPYHNPMWRAPAAGILATVTEPVTLLSAGDESMTDCLQLNANLKDDDEPDTDTVSIAIASRRYQEF